MILATGRADVTKVCKVAPSAAVRVINTAVSGDYTDVPCSAILDAEDTGQTSQALSNDQGGEPIAEARQKGIISSAACFAAGTAIFLDTRYGICPHGSTHLCGGLSVVSRQNGCRTAQDSAIEDYVRTSRL